jgi:hypothetical protein
MKSATALFLVLGLFGCDLLAPAPERVCNRMAKLCELKPADAKACSEELTKSAGVLGKERIDKMTTCVKESTTCAEAGGCMAGTGVAAVGEQLDNFMKGMDRALAK